MLQIATFGGSSGRKSHDRRFPTLPSTHRCGLFSSVDGHGRGLPDKQKGLGSISTWITSSRCSDRQALHPGNDTGNCVSSTAKNQVTVSLHSMERSRDVHTVVTCAHHNIWACVQGDLLDFAGSSGDNERSRERHDLSRYGNVPGQRRRLGGLGASPEDCAYM